MPSSFRRPDAPHTKLRTPDWYVSSLMMDRALDAVMRRVKHFDRKHDVPYLAGYSLDGKTIYIDRHMPKSLKVRGRTVMTDRFLVLHEEVEKSLIDQWCGGLTLWAFGSPWRGSAATVTPAKPMTA
jgi:hypothetical protein